MSYYILLTLFNMSDTDSMYSLLDNMSIVSSLKIKFQVAHMLQHIVV